MSQNPTLFVDLDNTLTRSDLLIESLVTLLRQDPLALFLLPIWLFRGRAYLKQQIVERTKVDVRNLVYDKEVLDYLRMHREVGCKLVLATASNQILAVKVAEHLGLFDDVIASSSDQNIKGSDKLAAIQGYLNTQNSQQGFNYLGDSHADIPIWTAAKRAIVVSPQLGVIQRLEKASIPVDLIHDGPDYSVYLKAMRPWQWIKNTLIFIPLILAKQLFDSGSFFTCMFAFISFSMVASAGYLLNDLFDLEADRCHPRKKNRPIAAGILPLWNVANLCIILLLSGLLLAWLVDDKLTLLLLIYFIMVTVYSLELKQYALVDVILIASFYATRIIAGGLAADVEISFWLLAYSIFIFLSLALVKRCTEIRSIPEQVDSLIPGRGYYKTDEPILAVMGVASGYLSVVVIALYLNSDEVSKLYNSPQSLWFVCPLLLYWISRMWLKVQRNEMNDDPLVFAMRDKISLVTGLLLILVMMLATVIQ